MNAFAEESLWLVQEVGGQAVLGRQSLVSTPWLTERHGYDPTSGRHRLRLGLRRYLIIFDPLTFVLD